MVRVRFVRGDDRTQLGGGQTKFGMSLMYDVPSNRYSVVQDSFIHQKSRRKVPTAPAGPESADRVFAGKAFAAHAAPMAPMAPMATMYCTVWCGTDMAPMYRYGTVRDRTVPYRTVRYRYCTIWYGTVPAIVQYETYGTYGTIDTNRMVRNGTVRYYGTIRQNTLTVVRLQCSPYIF